MDERTPMMRQFWDAKAAHPGMVVLFRNGDFYELFEDDAELGHRVLGIHLTRRDEKIPMAGFPHHKLEHYLGVLLRAGHRVAVCEQMELPGPGKKLIHREVNRVVTPGTVTEDDLLDPRRPNHLLAVWRAKGSGRFGLAWVDLSTGGFRAVDCDPARLADEVARVAAVECLLPEADAEALGAALGPNPPRSVVPRPGWTFDPETATQAVRHHFQVKTLAGFGFEDGQPCLVAAGAVLIYLQETLKANLSHIRRLAPFRTDEFLVLDEVTRRSLELTRTLRENAREGSLLSVIDRTVTPMGARYLHDALLAPLVDPAAVTARLDAVEELLHDHPLRGDVREQLRQTADLQRLTARVSTARAVPRDLVGVTRTLRLLPRLKAKLAGRRSPLLADVERKIDLCPDVRELLDRALIDEDPPPSVRDGGIIRDGYHAELDELRRLAKDGKSWIARYQAQEITRTGITSLKVGYNQVDGYYIEITNANETRTPPEYKHQKTLKNAKRYYTSALREYEEKVLSAEDKAKALECELFGKVRDTVAAQTPRLLATADALASADFLAGLAELAAGRGYVRPTITTEPVLEVRDGRHPVLDATLPPGTFVPNDAAFGPQAGTFWLITGPNMSGKSTFIRQVALLTLLAHVGSFVPARAATVGITDRIFTRVGASDELSRGHSTFMVEMTEAANILNAATARSLVILDEIGRGTSTYDGVSLAWAITEHLHDAVGCRALFATHYHELAQLEATLPRMRNYNVLVRETADEVVFLHKIAPGNADKSYGIHVARLAGVPEPVLKRAEQVLATLECRQELKAAPTQCEPLPPPAPEPPKPAGKPKRNGVASPHVVAPPEAAPRRRATQPAGPSLFGPVDAGGGGAENRPG
jgi:DNA mismatch repair protein MutS